MVEQGWNHASPENIANFDVYGTPPRVGVGLFDMWVFAELDNLEYIIEKYAWGFITATQARRALETFRSRCQHDPTFTQRAREFSRESAYSTTTCQVVEQIQRQLNQ
jgi:hypothetical protein